MLSLPPNSSDVLVMGTENTVFTHVARIEAFFSQGLRFEACLLQGVIVEAMLLLVLLIHRDAGHAIVADGRPVDLTGRTPTFGMTLKIVRDSAVIVDPVMLGQLDDYVDFRNQVVHAMAATLVRDEFDRPFQLGRDLIGVLRAMLWRLLPEPAAQA